jgi:hypothetical protein
MACGMTRPYSFNPHMHVHTKRLTSKSQLHVLPTAVPAPACLPAWFLQAVLWQGLIATEFLKLYGDACEARIMGLQELYISLAWPLDNPELARLLQQMLLVRAFAGVQGGTRLAGLAGTEQGEMVGGWEGEGRWGGEVADDE